MTSKRTDHSRLALSIVSHGQLSLICEFLRDLQRTGETDLPITLTINIHEDLVALEEFNDLQVSIIKNVHPKGFGENHNTAFQSTNCDFFAIVNPDIRISKLDEAILLSPFQSKDVGAVAPIVISPAGHIEDSVRRFPSIPRLIKRTIFRNREPDYAWDKMPIEVDWSAGMFVVYRAEAFKAIGGFDPRYFMYMEDADICLRLKRAGWRTVLQPACSVVHDARRASLRSFRHLRWHLASAFRFLFLPARKTPKFR